jgi:hypothetical protein
MPSLKRETAARSYDGGVGRPAPSALLCGIQHGVRFGLRLVDDENSCSAVELNPDGMRKNRSRYALDGSQDVDFSR